MSETQVTVFCGKCGRETTETAEATHDYFANWRCPVCESECEGSAYSITEPEE